MNRLPVVLLMTGMVMVPHLTRSQDVFRDFQTAHFLLHIESGISTEQARFVADYLEQELGYLRGKLGMEPERRMDVRLYAGDQRFRSATGSKSSDVVVVDRSVLHLPPLGRLEERHELAGTLSEGLSILFLESSRERGAPEWLVRSFAAYQSGRVANMTTPSGRRLHAFSDLSEEMQQAGPGDRERIQYLLGMTMKFLIDSYGADRAHALFKGFDRARSVEEVFQEVLGTPFATVEQSWSSFLATIIDDGSRRGSRGN